MDLVVYIICVIGILVVWAWVARPNGPDPEESEEASQAFFEGIIGLMFVFAFTVFLLVYILAF